MKKTQFIDLLTTIRNTRVSFIAIIMFLALGLAFYGGIAWTVAHNQSAADSTYREYKFQNFQVTAPFGLSEEQISELEGINGIDEAEGYNVVYRFFEINGEKQLAAVCQITENLNLLMNVEGEMPSEAGQAAVLRSYAEQYDIHIGDVIELSSEYPSDYRQLQSVKSVAAWDRGSLSDITFSQDDPGYLTDNTLEITALVDSPDYLATGSTSHGLCASNGLCINAVFYVTEEEMPPEAFGGYTSAALYSEELSSLSSFSEEYTEKSEALAEKIQARLNTWDTELFDKFALSVARFETKLGAVSAQTGGLSAESEELCRQLEEVRDNLSEGTGGSSSVSERNANVAFFSLNNITNILKNTKGVLGIAFLAVGILISYSAVSRLVSDSMVQIGTRKALGFRQREILRLYLFYVGTALLLGGILGAFLGVFGIEFAFTAVFAGQFTFSAMPLCFDVIDILIPFAVCGVVSILVAIFSCGRITRKKTVELLQEDHGDSVNYRVFSRLKLFRKLSLLNQTVIVNFFRDKQRTAGMIIGIAGATMLMTAGLTLYLNYNDSFSREFDRYYRFDYQIQYDPDSDTAAAEIAAILDENGLTYTKVYITSALLRSPDDNTSLPSVLVPEDTEALAAIMRFDTDDRKDISFESGVWIGDYYAHAFGAQVGDTLDVQTANGKRYEMTVTEFYRYHLFSHVIMIDADTYRDIFSDDAVSNNFYVDSAGVDMEDILRQISEVDGYIYSLNFYEKSMADASSVQPVGLALSGLFVLMSVILSLVMVVNLMNLYISEKKKELIILLVHGYKKGYVKRYIYQDTIFLAVISILLGLVLGYVLGDSAVSAFEGTTFRMLHCVNRIACVSAAAGMAGMLAVICVLTLRKVDKFRISDINAV